MISITKLLKKNKRQKRQRISERKNEDNYNYTFSLLFNRIFLDTKKNYIKIIKRKFINKIINKTIRK